MSIVSTDREIVGNSVRVYAGPTFVKPTGEKWVLITLDGVRIFRDIVTGEYRELCGADWITFRPSALAFSAVKRSVVGYQSFGDVFDAAAANTVVEYEVKFSSGVNYERDGWVFSKATGTRVGLFLTDWINRYGSARIALASDSASIDLTGIVPDDKGEINLDPTVTISGNSGYIDGYASNPSFAGGTWALARAGQNKTAATPNSIIGKSEHDVASIYHCFRGFMAFSTSGLDVASATLYLKTDAKYVDNGTVHVNICSDWTGGGLTAADFGATVGNSVGSVAVTGLTVNVWKTFAVTKTDIVDGTTPMIVREAYDVTGDGTPPPNGNTYGASFYGPDAAEANRPYLDITLASTGSSSERMMRGMGT